MDESSFTAALRTLATHPAARGLADDAAVLEVGGTRLVLTHDMLVEGVHFLPSDPPEDVAWKLLAVNLSDLAAKGALPLGVLLGYTLVTDAWDAAFARGLEEALDAFDIALLGGDTVSAPHRCLGLTALGEASGPVPARSGAAPGDLLWVSGEIGGAGLGLRILKGEIEGRPEHIARYRRPHPRLAAGRALAPLVSAMMDVSDGLLIDASRIAEASNLRLELNLACVPAAGNPLAAAAAGDDYELLFTASPACTREITAISETLSLPLTPIGTVTRGSGLALFDGATPLPLPARLGWLHGG